jgi:parvulin-like peptidyl-prolyl isomerase
MRFRILICGAVIAAAAQGQTQNANTQLVQRLKSQPVARINGNVLTQSDLLREMYAIFPYARTHNGFPKAMEADIRSGALKMIEFEELVYQEALRRKMVIPAVKMDRAVADFHKQFGSEADYKVYLTTEMGGSEEKLRTGVKRSLLIEQMLKSEVADRSVVTLAEAKAFYDKNPDRFRIPESFAFQTISILPPEKASASQLKEAAKRAADALKRAKATKSYNDFGLLAEKISDDDYRVSMGDHKAVDRSKLPPMVTNAVTSMQPGQVSDLIQIDQAYCIVRLNSHIPAGMQSFDEVKDGLRKQMSKDKSEQLRSTLNKKLRATAKVEEL